MAKTDAVRITTARNSAAADLRLRKRRYAWSMSIRLVCFLAAVIVGSGVLMWLLIAGAVFLPLVAVVIANATDQRNDGFTLGHPPSTHELTAGERDEH
jgi:fatty acid desaturase